MKDWRFRYHWNPSAMTMLRRVPPFPSIVFWPHTMNDWLVAKGDPDAVTKRFVQRRFDTPVRPRRSVA